MTTTTTALKVEAREDAFVAQFLIDKNGTRAAERAGFKNARIQSQRLLKRPRVIEKIKAALEAQQARTLITADQVLLDIKEIGDEARTEGKFEAALKSRELLGKHYKLFTDKHEHGGIGGGPVLFQITEKEADL